MASTFVKGLAFAAGLGLALGIGSAKRRAEGDSADNDSPDDVLSLNPVLDRLERIEERVSAVEGGQVSELDLRLGRQAKEIDGLRLEMSEHRQSVAREVAAVEKHFADITKTIPTVLESIIVPRVEDLRAHLRSETQQSINSSLTRFERAIDDKVSERIEALERVLLDQSTVVTGLSQRAVEADMTLQRLISAVERMSEPGAREEPGFLDLPFRKEAGRQQSEIPAHPLDSAFRPRIVR